MVDEGRNGDVPEDAPVEEPVTATEEMVAATEPEVVEPEAVIEASGDGDSDEVEEPSVPEEVEAAASKEAPSEEAVAEEVEPSEEAVVAATPPGQDFRWYALQTYSGHEKKVKTLLEQKLREHVNATNEDPPIREVIVPTQEVVEIKGGKRVKSTKRLYPGYVLIQMLLDQHTMFLVNSVPGVIKFVGGGDEPQPLKAEEINKILGIADELEEQGPETEIPFRPGQVVEVMEGPFSDFSGTVEEVFAEKGKVRVQVSLFGRPTSVELDYTQLQGF